MHRASDDYVIQSMYAKSVTMYTRGYSIYNCLELINLHMEHIGQVMKVESAVVLLPGFAIKW